MSAGGKAPNAMRTIGEAAAEIGVAAHVLRFWEARFPEVAPLTRAGGRRYYRADEITLLRAIARLTRERGMTLRGVERLLAERGAVAVAAEHGGGEGTAAEAATVVGATTVVGTATAGAAEAVGDWRDGVRVARDRLAAALDAYRGLAGTDRNLR